MLRATFLGTGGSVPTPHRNPSATLINRNGEVLLFDCGEGTQRQMMKGKTGIGKLTSVYITHFHADHFMGIPGLVQTLSLQGRNEPLEIYGPHRSEEFIGKILSAGYFRSKFEVRVKSLKPGDVIRRKEYEIRAIKTEHTVPSIGYVLEEYPRRGKFNREKAIELGVPPGPLFSKLHSGEPVVVKERRINPEEVVGPPRKGRKIVYTGDTRPTEEIAEESTNADLLIHDGTLSEEMKNWALETKHSTVSEAAEIARHVNVRKLVLTHISSRYANKVDMLEKEARQIFEDSTIAEEFMTIDVPYPE